MAYDPADLRLPPWLLRLLDALVRIHLPLAPGWRFGFTRPGILFFGVLLGVWAAALYSSNNLLYLCGAILLVMAITAGIGGARLLASLTSLAEYLPATVKAGEVYVQRRRLAASLPVAGLVRLHWAEDVQALVRVESGQGLLGLRLPARQRGVCRYSRTILATSAPLGLWRLQHVRAEGWQLAVLPQPVPWLGTSSGNAVAFLGGMPGDEWRDLRPYVRGDQLSRIHWRKVAQGDWAVKRFAAPEGGEEAGLLRVDLRAAPGPKFERLLGMAYAWMLAHPRGALILGQERFDLADPDQCRAAEIALAAAAPETRPPAGSGGVLLSIAPQRRAA